MLFLAAGSMIGSWRFGGNVILVLVGYVEVWSNEGIQGNIHNYSYMYTYCTICVTIQ